MSDSLTKTLRAVSDSTRRDLFHAVLQSEEPVPLMTLSDRFDMTRQGVTKHLKVLGEAGLVSFERRGQRSFLHADASPLLEVNKWVCKYEKMWDKSLDNLTAYLDKN